MPRRKAPVTPDALLDQILAGADARAALESRDLIDGQKKALAERALNAEMDHHLAGEGGAGNRRNGYGAKTVMSGDAKMGLDVPRDRLSSFDPQLLTKYQMLIGAGLRRRLASQAVDISMTGGVTPSRLSTSNASGRKGPALDGDGISGRNTATS